MNKTLLTGGLLAGLVAGSGAGFVLETSGLVGAAPAVVSQATTEPAAPGAGTGTGTGGDRATGRSGRIDEILQPLVDDGTLTPAQRDAVVDALRDAAPLGGHGRDGDRRERGMRGRGLEAAAAAIGVTTEELRAALRDGRTIAEVAGDEGVEVRTVIDAMVVEAGTHLAEHVAAGDLTQAQADARLEEITDRITDLVNNGAPADVQRPRRAQ